MCVLVLLTCFGYGVNDYFLSKSFYPHFLYGKVYTMALCASSCFCKAPCTVLIFMQVALPLIAHELSTSWLSLWSNPLSPLLVLLIAYPPLLSQWCRKPQGAVAFSKAVVDLRLDHKLRSQNIISYTHPPPLSIRFVNVNDTGRTLLLSEGISVKTKPDPGSPWRGPGSLSGGQAALVGLALNLATQAVRPGPLHLMDEVRSVPI